MFGYILRYIVYLEGILMLLPLTVSVVYGEKTGLSYLVCAALCILIAFPFTLKKPKNTDFQVKEGFIAVALGWIVLSVMGALPFIISGHIPNPIDALFETVSGFTTTGASILRDVESLPHCHLFWRSFTHWLGGMGVLVFILTILPMSGGSHMNLMKAESPGPSVDKLAPKVKTTAKILYGIYIAMTVMLIVILICGKMPVFDALCISFGTAGTGGFGVRNDSMASYNVFCQSAVTVFMILFGVNFSFYFLLLSGKPKKAFKLSEVITYFIIILSATGIVCIGIYNMYGKDLAKTIQDAAFQVGSIITTTGFTTADFNLWPAASRTVLVMLMFIGACAGSTGGGIKVSRFILLFKALGKELHSIVHPRSVKKVTMGSKVVEHEIVRSTNVYMTAYIVIFAISVLLVSFDGFDLITNFTAVAATFNNIGPGLEAVGPTANFADLSNFSKLVLTFDMLAGRLEIFPMLLLFYRKAWKKF